MFHLFFVFFSDVPSFFNEGRNFVVFLFNLVLSVVLRPQHVSFILRLLRCYCCFTCFMGTLCTHLFFRVRLPLLQVLLAAIAALDSPSAHSVAAT